MRGGLAGKTQTASWRSSAFSFLSLRQAATRGAEGLARQCVQQQHPGQRLFRHSAFVPISSSAVSRNHGYFIAWASLKRKLCIDSQLVDLADASQEEGKRVEDQIE